MFRFIRRWSWNCPQGWIERTIRYEFEPRLKCRIVPLCNYLETKGRWGWSWRRRQLNWTLARIRTMGKIRWAPAPNRFRNSREDNLERWEFLRAERNDMRKRLRLAAKWCGKLRTGVKRNMLNTRSLPKHNWVNVLLSGILQTARPADRGGRPPAPVRA